MGPDRPIPADSSHERPDVPLSGETLQRRVRTAEASLRKCNLCELRCGVNRAAGQRGRCGLAADTHVYKTYVSLNEELELVPALRVFLGGCNFRCPWCDEAPEAFDDVGQRVTAESWARELQDAVDGGVTAISLLGGEPTVHAHTILALAAAAPRPLPLAINTNMYMTPEVLALFDGVVQWYLADFKFGNDACARRFGAGPRYSDVVRRNLLTVAASDARLIVRHVLLPGHVECCFRPVADWVAEHLPGARFQLYPGYIPCGAASCDPEIGRLNARSEVQAATEYLAKLELRRHAVGPPASSGDIPATLGAGLASLTLGADGRIYCHDLTPELAALLAALCPIDGELRARRRDRGGAPLTPGISES